MTRRRLNVAPPVPRIRMRAFDPVAVRAPQQPKAEMAISEMRALCGGPAWPLRCFNTVAAVERLGLAATISILFGNEA